MTVDINFFFRILIFPGFMFLFFLTLFCDWFERKVEARMENRVGPAWAGPAGLFQPFADFVKLLGKAEIVPQQARFSIFSVMPFLAFSLFVYTFFCLPIDGNYVIPTYGYEGDLIVVLALISVANLTLFLSGWSSSNPLSQIGASRVLTQFLGYEIPLFLLALNPAFLSKSLSLATITSKQTIPYIILIPWVFTLFLISTQAELERDPFDVPHAETEIVGGYETEFSGAKLAFLKLSKDVQVVLGAALTVELFLGGPYGPTLFGFEAGWYSFWFVAKVLLVIFLSELLTSLFARLRIDYVVRLGWKTLLPLSLLMLIVTGCIESIM